MKAVPSLQQKALLLIVILNVTGMALFGFMVWVSWRKAAETADMRAKFQPVEQKAGELIESERDIERLRGMARIQSIGAAGTLEALLHITNKSNRVLLSAMIIPLVSVLLGAYALRRRETPPVETEMAPGP